MITKLTKYQENEKLRIAQAVVEGVQDIDADIDLVAQEMVQLGVVQLRNCGINAKDILDMVEHYANFVPKTKIN